MASFTTPTLHATGDLLTVADWSAVANNTTFLFQAPAANVFNSVSTSIGNGTPTQVTLDGTVFLKYGFSVSSNNLVVPIAGIYAYTGQVFLASAAVHAIFSQVEHNGTVISQSSVPLNADTDGAPTAGIVACNASDTLGLWCTQTSGGALSTNATSGNTYLTAWFVGSL